MAAVAASASTAPLRRPRLAGHPGRRRSLAGPTPTPPTTRRATAADAPSSSSPPPTTALLIEVDGALVDLVQSGHRVAFNRAFAEMGLADAAGWTPPAFEAALRRGGTGEALVAARLDQAGAWPPGLGTASAGSGAADSAADRDSGAGRQAFARRVHEAKQRAFAELVASGGLPLRPDVATVVDGALAAGAVVALVAETASAPDEGAAGAALRALGEERAARVRVLTAGVRRRRRRRSGGGADGGEDGGDEGGEEEEPGGALQLAVARHKAAAAREFAERLAGASGAAVDVSALTGGASAALLGVPAARCACVAATAATVRAAAGAGMVAVAVPRQAAFDVSFPEARAKFEAYGPGYLTWPRLAAMVDAAAAAPPASRCRTK